MMLCAFILLTGCGGSSGEDNQNNAEKTGVVKLGIIKYLNVTETLFNSYFEKSAARMNQTKDIYASKHIFFDNMTSMLAALESKQIDGISTYNSVGNYLVANNSGFAIDENNVPKLSDSFCCAMREDNAELKDDFNAAILKLKANGTLDKLVDTYIKNVKADEPMQIISLPHFDGVDTIKVAVTGDLPPMDYVTADGNAAGFNIALLAEISKVIGKNFELINVDSGARAIALISEQADVVFWVAVSVDKIIIPANWDVPDGIVITEPYFTDEITHVKLSD